MAIIDFDYAAFPGNRDPYPIYAQMRDTGRVLRSSDGAVMVTRYDDVRNTHADFSGFSMAAMGGDMMGQISRADDAVLEELSTDEAVGLANTLLTIDPPSHDTIRRVVNRAFTPRSIIDREERVREIARELLAPLAKGEPFDIVTQFAGPLPTIVIAEMLGVPPEDMYRFVQWSKVTGTDAMSMSAETTRQFRTELREYFAAQVADRKKNPTDDLIGRMAAANDEQVMSDIEVVASCELFLSAGNDTTMRLLSNMIVALGRHPEQRERLVDDAGLIPNGVEEALRYDPPVQFLFRASKEEAVVGDTEIAPGELVLTMLACANRDADVFDDAETFDVGRPDIMHVSFGHGIHYCIGSPLARQESRVGIEELLDVAPTWKVLTSDDDIEYDPTGLLRGPKSFMVQV
ncbi:MAG: cytochrome P450 [Acidimicrobiia bacterium]